MKLLLPYAYDIDGNLIKIEDAVKGQKYFCPICKAELLLRICKKQPGAKYYRRNHFAHKGNSENRCSESFLHMLFKERCAELLRDKISRHENLFFEWECKKCYEHHKGNILKKASNVITECDLAVCKPDIALLDSDGKVIIVVEVVVTHKPEPESLEYYEKNKIACLQIIVNDFSDCEHIEEKLSLPDDVNVCPNPVCDNCGQVKNKAKMVIIPATCWRCGGEMKVAMILANNERGIITASSFNEEEINQANSLGANIAKRYSKTVENSYMANVCEHCNAFIGDFYMHDYYYSQPDKEKDLSYICFHCNDI